MLDLHTQAHGYEEVNVPVLVNSDSMQGRDSFQSLPRIPSSWPGKVLTGWPPRLKFRSQIWFEESFWRRIRCRGGYVAHTLCFRSEAGSYGRDTRGMIRQHQFEKVELVHITRPEDSWATFDALVGHAEAVLAGLALPQGPAMRRRPGLFLCPNHRP